jgi:WD40 repeat protein
MPPDEKWWIVLADFGISKRADESNGPTTTVKGTATFMAPELLGFLDQFRPKSIDDFKAADMWALGEIVFQMLIGEATFQNPMELMTYCLGQRRFPLNRLPIFVRDDCHDFVASIMTVFPRDRMTTAQSLQHRWMGSLRIEEEFATLDLEHTRPLVPGIPQNESASARWSDVSNLQDRTTQTTAQWRPEGPTHLDSSDVRQTRLKSLSGSPAIQPYINTDQEPLTFTSSDKCVQTLKGHRGYVASVAFSHDSTWLASGSFDKTVKIWDTSSGECIQTLKGHVNGVASVAFSHDSTRLASGSWDRMVKIWDTSSGECVQTLTGHSDHVESVAFSHNSIHLASGSWDKTVKIWDTSSGEYVQTFKEHSNNVASAAFSHNSTHLASGSWDGTVNIWDTSSGKCIQTLEDHRYNVESVAFSHDSTQLASGSWDSKVMIWDTSSGKCVQTLEGHRHSVESVAFSHDSAWLASGSVDKTVMIWDTSSGKCVQTLEDHRNSVTSVAFSHDSTRLASGSWDMTVKIWSASRRSRAIMIGSGQ